MKTQKYKTVKNSMCKILFGIFMLIFTNCSKSPIGCLNGSWIQEVSADLEKWTAASNTYSEEPTEENCASYKNAINSYLSALDGIKNCVPAGSISDFDGSLDEARQELSEIDCTEN